MSNDFREILNESFRELDIPIPKKMVSFAWIEPNGTIHFLESLESHNSFAKSMGKTIEELINQNWIKVSNPLTIEIKNKETLNRESFKSYVDKILSPYILSDDFISKFLKLGMEELSDEDIYIFYEDTKKIQDNLERILKKYSRGTIDSFYEKLFSI